MANNALNVSAGKPKVTGAVWLAPIGSTLPTDSSTALDVAFKCLGYCGEDGLVNANSPETENVLAWGGDVVLTTLTEKPDTFQFKLLEMLNLEVLKTVYGDGNVTGTLDAGVKVDVKAEQPSDYSWVFELVMRGGVLKRIVVPQAAISEMDDIEYTDSDAAGYNITITATPDTNGCTHIEYLSKPKA